jgi:hypothetical protein
MKNGLTIEQHFKNVEVAVIKAVGTFDELNAIRNSFLTIKEYVVRLEKEIKEFEIKGENESKDS